MPLNYQWDELLLLGRSMSKLCFGGKSYLVFRRSTAIFIISATEAIVRLAPNNSDVYMGHNTWTGFYSMLRLLKDSDFGENQWKVDPSVPNLCGMKGEIVLPFHCCFVRNMIFLWVAVQIVLSRVDFWQHFDKFKTFQRSETLSQP